MNIAFHCQLSKLCLSSYLQKLLVTCRTILGMVHYPIPFLGFLISFVRPRCLSSWPQFVAAPVRRRNHHGELDALHPVCQATAAEVLPKQLPRNTLSPSWSREQKRASTKTTRKISKREGKNTSIWSQKVLSRDYTGAEVVKKSKCATKQGWSWAISSEFLTGQKKGAVT